MDKCAGPAHKSREQGGNHEKTAKLYCSCKVQEVITSRFTRSARCASTTSITQDQVAREEWKEDESKASDKPHCSKIREHKANQHNARTASVQANLRQQRPWSCVSMRAQSVIPSMRSRSRSRSLSRVTQVERPTVETKANCCRPHAAARGRISEDTKAEEGRHHLQPHRTRLLLLIGYLE